jgi:hypothetical protein
MEKVIITAASPDGWAIATFIVTAIGVAAVIVYTWYAKKQKDLSQESLDAANKSSAAALAAAQRSNEATQESNRIAKDSLEFGLRAWLVARAEERQAPASTTTIVVTNVGRVPATRVIVREQFVRELAMIAKFIKHGGPLGFVPMSAFPWVTGSVIGPGLADSYDTAPRPNYPQEDGAVDKSEEIFLYCEIEYRDVFDKPRETIACWRFGLDRSGEWGWKPTSEYNWLK